ncbi:type VI secretion system protein TssL, long form [Gallaecimonas mangrovi]|uniref:type VI secretion system protein TssL, long form n=1 Tax=Gallaecimonas mangrovi TaxID=2291597 RepID=UPI000E208A50|nr:type VI secretion system protein TssL, long form [Gallaecimonas mangrovi]
MNDSTIIKPRPGARQAVSRPAPAPDNQHDDKTALASVSDDFQRGRFRLPTTHLEPLVDDASKILSLANRLAQASSVDDISTLKRQCMDLIREYQRSLQSQQQPADTINMASYCLCALLDEIVLNSPWGGSGQWAASSLLSEFHSETLAGIHFFELVEKAQRTGDIPLLTLQFLCLSLGFKGKYRVENLGQEALDGLKDRIYQQICGEKGRFATPFEGGWEQKLVPGNELAQRFPLWVAFAFCGVLLLLLYMFFAYQINHKAQPVFLDMARVAIDSKPVAATGQGDLKDSPDAKYLRQILQTEIAKGMLSMVYLPDRIRMRIGNEALFDSGSATVRQAMTPVLDKIARALESTHGKILITGHTDDQPIFTSKYPSNWHLSLARANAVADVLAHGGKLDGRLWPEGRGAAEPLVANDSAAHRALNRRVEIDLIAEAGK